MQVSSSQFECSTKKRQTQRERFLAEVEAVVPWTTLTATIEPFYPKSEGRSRPPIGLERMLRMYIAQQCFGLSDEGVEDAVYDSQAIRGFVGIDLSRENAPEATTLLKPRRPLEKLELTERIFQSINEPLAAKGLMLREKTVVNASIIAAPPSTKYRDGKRDPEMHQGKKGNQWHFGRKAHIGVDADSCLTHTLVTTPANAADVTRAHELFHGEVTDAFGDAGYRSVEKRDGQKNVATRWHAALRPGKRRALQNSAQGRIAQQVEQLKASVRAKIEHPFHIIKNRFGLKKVRYRAFKNTAQLYALLAMANLLIAKRRLMALHARGAS